MKLSDEQIQIIASKLAGGATLSEIQTLIISEFKVQITYMDTRFLIDDLDLTLADKKKPAEPKPAAPSAPIDAEAEIVDDEAAAFEDAFSEAGGSGAVTVEVDKIMRPGAALSGTVVFSDSETAVWFLDHHGRLGLDPTTEGYQPSPEDIQEFQMVLQSKLSQHGAY